MRLLILSFSYAPRSNPRATRWTALAEHFVREGHSVAVITSWQQGLPEQETCQGVEVYRVGLRALERLRRTLSTSPAAGASPGGAKPRRAALRLLRALNRMIWRNLWWPDSACTWLGPALKTARALVAKQPADAVISVSPAFSAVVVGHILARDRPRCRRWIIDLGDPFSFMDLAAPNNALIYGWLNRWFERRAFLRADGISVTTEGTREMYERLYPACAGKITVIPPLLSPLPGSAGAVPFFPNDSATRLVFIGTLYRNLRRPDYLLRLFSAMLDIHPESDCELHLIGNTHECRDSLDSCRQRLGERLVVHAPVDRSLAARAMDEADILVNLGNETAFQLPSKLIEYAATGKRIINISSLAADSSTAFLANYPRALCIQEQRGTPSAAQVAEFASFCGDQSGHKVDARTLEDFLRPFGLTAVSSRYGSLLAPPRQQP